MEEIKSIIGRMNLPTRKLKSKMNYSVYLIKHDLNNYYIGSTKDTKTRFKSHSKSKNVLSIDILYETNSLANAKIVESYLILYYKLFTNYSISNKRSESTIF